MLRRLSIKNFILIRELSIDFDKGYTAITGETGSGKSILLNALGLIKGERADFDGIGSNGNRSVVEATFDSSDAAKQFIMQEGFEPWDEIVMRREIHKDGRSRGFINDTPATLVQMKTLGEQLLIIHSQYNTLELRDKAYQLMVLDALAGTTQEFNSYYQCYQAYNLHLKAIEEDQNRLQEMESKLDYEQFVLAEILTLNLSEINYEDLSAALDNAEKVQAIEGDLTQLIAITEGELQNELNSIASRINRYTANDDTLTNIQRLIDEVKNAFNELNFEASKAVNSLDSKQVNRQELLDKVDEFNRILNKHRLSNQESLAAYQSQLELRMDELNDLKHKIETSKKEIEQLKLNLIAQANELNSNRLNALPAIESEIQAGLSALKLKGATLHFNLSQRTEINSKGMVDIDILFSANQGLTPVPIQKAASGGELSRVMLLLHQLISNKRTLPCILFDEIDTGVSGEVAEKIGILLNEMGKGRQLIAITHLPQVASKANYHLLVKKVEDSLPVETQLVKLSMKERIVEIARLMSGQEINDAAIINAQKLLGVNEA